MWPVFLELTQDIGHKLRVHQKCADGVAIHIRDNTLFSKQWQISLDMPTQSPMLIAKTAFNLFEKKYDWKNPIRSVTIQAINLVPQDTPRQVDFFTNVERLRNWKNSIYVLKQSENGSARIVLKTQSFVKI